MKRSVMIVAALGVISGGAQLAVAADGKAVYDKSCGLCHNSGGMGAVKLGDKEKWAPIIQKGPDALLESVTKGKGKMKPKAGNDALTADDIKAANEYIISKSK